MRTDCGRALGGWPLRECNGAGRRSPAEEAVVEDGVFRREDGAWYSLEELEIEESGRSVREAALSTRVESGREGRGADVRVDVGSDLVESETEVGFRKDWDRVNPVLAAGGAAACVLTGDFKLLPSNLASASEFDDISFSSSRSPNLPSSPNFAAKSARTVASGLNMVVGRCGVLKLEFNPLPYACRWAATSVPG